MRSRPGTLLPMFVTIVLAGSSYAFGANGPTAKEQLIAARAAAQASGRFGAKGQSPDFGTLQGSTINIHAYEFQGLDPSNDLILDDGNGFRYFASAAGSHFLAAPVTGIPSGAIIDFVQISDCSANPLDMALELLEAPYGTGSSAGTIVTHINTLAGCGAQGNLGIGYPIVSNFGHPLWLLLFHAATYDGSTKFNDVTIGYHRQVSPAPGTATFADVPLSDPAFQYIEALVASGITAGCGGGNYCPDGTLTRRQMAVFLAKALGLHFPD